jgi:type III secretory pathway component EscS
MENGSQCFIANYLVIILDLICAIAPFIIAAIVGLCCALAKGAIDNTREFAIRES